MTDISFSLDVARDRQRMRDLDAPPRLDIASHIRAAARQGGAGFSLGREIWRLGHGPGRLSIAEYFYYRLYDPALSFAEKTRFVGKRAQGAMHRACNDAAWFAVAHDKFLFDAVMRGSGLPVPAIRAVYTGAPRTVRTERLADASALARYLADPRTYPCFAKPIDGMFSVGGLDLAGLRDGRIRLGNGASVEPSDLARYVTEFGGAGYLFQERLTPHSALERAFGPTLGTVRILLLLDPSGPKPLSAACKIPSSRNMADNFWRAGNMLGAVALDGGAITRVISGVGESHRLHQRHPDTDVQIEGLVLPGWGQALELCQAAAGLFPAIRTQSWDIALTDKGPVALEFNFGGDLNLHQLAHGKGLLDETYAAHLRRCGYRLK